MECLGSVLTNKYAEGLPKARYYGGNEYVDMVSDAIAWGLLAADDAMARLAGLIGRVAVCLAGWLAAGGGAVPEARPRRLPPEARGVGRQRAAVLRCVQAIACRLARFP